MTLNTASKDGKKKHESVLYRNLLLVASCIVTRIFGEIAIHQSEGHFIVQPLCRLPRSCHARRRELVRGNDRNLKRA